MRTLALAATILMVATGCDKATRWQAQVERQYVAFIDRVSGVAEKGKPLPPAYTSLVGEPPVLFHVFGKRSDPRMIPLGVVQQGRLRRLILTGRGWREFTQSYTSPGDSLRLFQDGQFVGAAGVRSGMWSADSALYTLPRCTLPLPLTLVSLPADVSAGRATVEAFASNRALGRTPEEITLSPAQVQRTGKDIGLLVAGGIGMKPETVDSLDATTIAVPTGRAERPTLVIQLLEAGIADSLVRMRARQVFVLADAGPLGYGPTYWYFQRGGSQFPAFRRYVDHLDVDGDGLDEIIIEAWFANQSGTYMIILGQRANGNGWEERYRTDPDWCQDRYNMPPSESDG